VRDHRAILAGLHGFEIIALMVMGATFLSLKAVFVEFFIGLAGVILVWQLAKYVFGKSVREFGPIGNKDNSPEH